MKKKFIYILGLLTLFMSSCMDNFLDRNPYGDLDEKTFFTKKEHADLAAIACYSTLQKMNGHWADAQLELGMTGDFSSAGFKDAQAYYTASFNPNDANVVNGIWKKGYEGIAICNNNIYGLEQMRSDIIDDATKNKHLAEMKFIRAFWYFRLIRFYGDIPLRSSLVTDPSNKEQVMLPLTSKEKIISDIILPDLVFASQNLPVSWDAAYHNRATKGAAYATLTELYVYIKDYDKAIASGLEVEKSGYKMIDNPGYVLRVDYEGSSEIIFSIGYGTGNETYREFYYGTTEDLGGSSGRIMRGDTYSGDYFYASRDFIDFFQTIDGKSINDNSPYFNKSEEWKYRDPRFDGTFFTTMDEITTTSGVKMNWKSEWLINDETGFDIQKRGVYYGDNTWNRRMDNTLIRLPRVYLLMAEAYAFKSSPEYGKANEYLNKTRTRAREFALNNRDKYIPSGISDSEVLPSWNVSTKEQAMTALNYENRVEFFTEDCYRYFDLKRWGTLSEEWSRVGGFTWNDKFIDLPIPSNEVSNNDNISQKQSWGN
ncbi:MAG: RagB/SusD family nutrient uptake outer membrane protein [Dysgonamonadaceae bacterium]|nr:RagB/SusD family nutrient uptake outer membrane protein [Dysgonamonadaceae bacterium]